MKRVTVDGATSVLGSLAPRRHLDEIPAGVVEDGCGDRTHLDRLLDEAYAKLKQPLELALEVGP